MLIRSRLVVLSAVVAFGAAMTSCENVPPEYSVGFYNATGGDITDARADWQAGGRAYHESLMILSVGAEGAAGEQPRPIPESAAVTWKTADGKVHNAVVAVAKLIADPPGFAGTIYFKFGAEGGVTVVPLTYAQERQAAEHGRSALRDGFRGK